jgi:hypothetical protein
MGLNDQSKLKPEYKLPLLQPFLCSQSLLPNSELFSSCIEWQDGNKRQSSLLKDKHYGDRTV